MSQSPTAEILILARKPATAERWAGMLRGPETRIWLTEDELLEAARVDLILTDRPPGEEASTGRGVERLWENVPSCICPPGLIRIGLEGAADVHLPVDVSERELRLVCRLLGEVVRLRRDNRAQTASHSRLTEEALTDPLTGLANRRAWDRAARSWLDSVGVRGKRICLAIIDLDHFKGVNDSHGHAAGDEVLRGAAEAILGGLRQADFVARLGGDEFGLLLRVDDEATARRVLDRIRGRISSELTRRGGPSVTASAGFRLADSRDPGAPLPSPESLFLEADGALRRAKEEGRDRTVGSARE